tara:strand:- start:179 stop:652 length:474 start_codon:yes stop_codon:yes gene_type:complete
MVKPNIFKATAAVFILYRVYTYIKGKQRLLDKAAFKVGAISFRGIEGKKVVFDLAFNVENTTQEEMKAGLFDFTVFANGLKIGTALNNDFVEIAPFSKISIPFIIKTDVLALGPAVKKLVQNFLTGKPISVGIKGTMSIETVPGVYNKINVNKTETL